MARFDSHNDSKQIVTVHDRLEFALEEREKNTLEQWQKDRPDAPHDTPIVSILSCPTEVLDGIFKYVSANRDLARVCLVNKRFFASALPILYRTLHIRIEPMIDHGLLRMLTRENTGMRFVRHVYAYPCKVGPGGKSLLHQCVDMLVNQLPRNQLRSFHWLDREAMPAMVMTTLWQRQRRLRNIEIIPEADLHRRQGRQSEHRSQLERLSFLDLEAVHVVLKGPHTVRNANIALNLGKVIDLTVDALSWVGKDPYEYNEEPGATDPDADADPDPDAELDSEDESENATELEQPPPFTPDPESPVIDMLTENLFRNLMRVKPGYTPPFSQITSLSLKDINLTRSKHTWFTYLDLAILKTLNIKYCEGADLFLLRLTDCFPRLASLDLTHRLSPQSDRTSHAIEELLQHSRGTGLRDLKLCLRNASRAPNILPIVKHRETLERLQIDVAERPLAMNRDAVYPTLPPNQKSIPARQYGLAHLVYTSEHFGLLIKSCYNLRELSIAFPAYNLFFTHLGANAGQNPAFHKYLNIIVKNLQLCTLNIVNWPQDYEWMKLDGYYKAKNASLARLAAIIFKRQRTYDPNTEDFTSLTPYSPLDIVSFGINERITPGVSAPRAAHFLQSTFDAREGLKGFAVQQVKELELWKRALDIDVLNYDARDFDKACREHTASHWYEAYDDGDLEAG